MPFMIYLDVSSAASSAVNMGVHRTVRGIDHCLKGLSLGDVTPLRWDFSSCSYATLSAREQGFLENPFQDYKGAQALPGRWPWRQWKQSWMDQRTRAERRVDLKSCLSEKDLLLIPDLCWDRRIEAWPSLAEVAGKKIAVFHDAMPLNLPGQSGSNDKLFRDYVCALACLDHVICISQEVQADLLRYWEQFGVKPKPTSVITWPVPFRGERPQNAPNFKSRQLIYVARLKLRKNHLILLDAAEQLWRAGVSFRLDLIGVEDAYFDTRRILRRVQELRRAGHPVQWRKHISDEELNQAYAESAFTVFPSQMEGFGLPILESLWHARPVICGSNGALGEVAQEGGGCLLVDQNSVVEVAEAMRRLLADEVLYEELYQQARKRGFRSWEDYGKELKDLLPSPT
jgi:glycosyltransferase involved in cell wall biosynthesis